MLSGIMIEMVPVVILMEYYMAGKYFEPIRFENQINGYIILQYRQRTISYLFVIHIKYVNSENPTFKVTHNYRSLLTLVVQTQR